jgi:hypothetical protein
LGPEATGPWHVFLSLAGWAGVVWVLFVSGFLAAPIMHGCSFWGGVWGVWFGVVV